METKRMNNKYSSLLLAIFSVLLIDSVSSIYRSYSYRSYSYYRYSYYYYYRSYRYSLYYYYYYSSSSSGSYYSAGATAGAIIGILIAVGIITAAIVAICYFCFRKKRASASAGRVIQTGTVATVSSTNAYVAPPPGQAVNGSYTYPTTTYTTTAENVSYAPGNAMAPPEYKEVAGDSTANGEAKQTGQGHTDQGHPPPYSADDVNAQPTHDTAKLVEPK